MKLITTTILRNRNWLLRIYIFWYIFSGIRNLLINSFVRNAPFLYPMKTFKKITVFWCFQKVKKGCIGNKWIKSLRKIMFFFSLKTKVINAWGALFIVIGSINSRSISNLWPRIGKFQYFDEMYQNVIKYATSCLIISVGIVQKRILYPKILLSKILEKRVNENQNR